MSILFEYEQRLELEESKNNILLKVVGQEFINTITIKGKSYNYSGMDASISFDNMSVNDLNNLSQLFKDLAEYIVLNRSNEQIHNLPPVYENNNIVVQWRKFREGAIIPTKSTSLANGWDVYACTVKDIFIEPGERAIINTGLNLKLPLSHYMYLQPRSGLAAKHGITVVNTPGLIDVDYAGEDEKFELKVILLNTDKHNTFVVKQGDRIGQVTFHRHDDIEFEEVTYIDGHDSNRTGGLGSTGK